MNAKWFSLCSVALIALLTTSGCYTVFQKKTVDGKPPAVITDEVIGEYSGDMTFHSYTHERWTHYLLCPWWEESIFSRSRRSEDEDVAEPVADEELVDESTLPVTPPDPEPPAFMRAISTSSAPASAPNSETREIRRKPTDDGKTSEPQTTEQPESNSKSDKPQRRTGPGGRR